MAVPEFPNNSQLPDQGVETRLGRFFQKINQFLKREPPPVDLKLQGRIRELQTSADKILLDLLNLKSALEDIVEPNIFALASNIIDPIIKEISRIQKAIEQQDGATQQVKTFHRYMEWMDKAKTWIELGTKKQYQQDLIQQAIVDHTIQEFYARIDRDIQVIQDYLHNSLNRPSVEHSLKHELQQGIEPQVLPYIAQLEQLKVLPEDLSLNALTQWKVGADQAREKYFGAVLHIIDSFAHKIGPSDQGDHESEHALEILLQLDALEEKISELAEQIEDIDALDDRKLKMCNQTLMHLEEEAHDLNTNLRLPQEHSERVQQAIESLSALRDNLSA